MSSVLQGFDDTFQNFAQYIMESNKQRDKIQEEYLQLQALCKELEVQIAAQEEE